MSRSQRWSDHFLWKYIQLTTVIFVYQTASLLTQWVLGHSVVVGQWRMVPQAMWLLTTHHSLQVTNRDRHIDRYIPGWCDLPQRQEQMPEVEGVWAFGLNSLPAALPMPLTLYPYCLFSWRHLPLFLMRIFVPSPLSLCVLLCGSHLLWKILPTS